MSVKLYFSKTFVAEAKKKFLENINKFPFTNFVTYCGLEEQALLANNIFFLPHQVDSTIQQTSKIVIL